MGNFAQAQRKDQMKTPEQMRAQSLLNNKRIAALQKPIPALTRHPAQVARVLRMQARGQGKGRAQQPEWQI